MNGEPGEILILGSGGHAAVVAESAVRAGWRVIGTAAAQGGTIGDPDGAGAAEIERAARTGAALHAAVGSADVRERWTRRFAGARFATVVDPSALVSPSARIEHGAYIGAGAIVQARASIGAGAIVNTRAIVEHDCVVREFAHLAPASVLCGSVTIERGAQVGAGAVVIPGRAIGAAAVVGAGAVVVRDIAAGATAVGVPAIPRPPTR